MNATSEHPVVKSEVADGLPDCPTNHKNLTVSSKVFCMLLVHYCTWLAASTDIDHLRYPPPPRRDSDDANYLVYLL